MKTSIAPILFGRNIANISEKHFTPGFVLMTTTRVWFWPQRSPFLIHPHRTGFWVKNNVEVTVVTSFVQQ